MSKESLIKYIAAHSGFTDEDVDNFNCFVKVTTSDSSDHSCAAIVRYKNPDNANDCAYDVYILEDIDQPSLIYWKISRVFSYYKDLFNKKNLTEAI